MTRPVLFATCCLTFASLLLSAGQAVGQTVIVIHHPTRPVPLPRPIPTPQPQPETQPETPSYKITRLEVNATVKDQVAQVQVAQEFQNTGSQQMEVRFLFPLPYDGAIDSLTLMVDGKEFPAKLLTKEKAREIYESIVRQNKDPALLEWTGTGMFQTSVFPVPAGASREVTLTYTQVLKKDGRLTDFIFPLSTAKYTDKPVEKVKIRLSLEASEKLKSIYSPTHEVEIERNGDRRAVVTLEQEHTVPENDFRLFFESSKDKFAASVLTYRPDKDEQGYFLLLASPPPRDKDAEVARKTVIFVVDRSGSMSGEKIEQAREAAKHVLKSLNKEDLFNIVAYDSDVESFRPELQKADKKSIEAATGFVDDLYAGGSTNIEGALTTALGMIHDDERPCYILFLSDGRPTHGETNEMKIVEAAEKANKHGARTINVGVGYDVNSRLMDRLSAALRGQSQYVRPDEDLEEHVARLYRKISAPVMTDVKLKFDLEDGGDSFVNRVLPEDIVDLFEGQQLVLAGRYKKHGAAKITLRGKVEGETETHQFSAEFVEKSEDQSHAFVAKIWAMRRIGEIIDQLDLHGKNDELLEELVKLSTEHGILTPYTSFLADENQSREELADARAGGARSLNRLRMETEKLGEAAGRSGFTQRAIKQSFQQAARPNAVRSSSAWSYDLGLDVGATIDAQPDEHKAVETVRTVGGKTLFQRDGVWIDQETLAAEDEPQPVEIERFTAEYFELIAENTQAENRVLAQQQAGEKLLIKLRGTVYLIR